MRGDRSYKVFCLPKKREKITLRGSMVWRHTGPVQEGKSRYHGLHWDRSNQNYR